MIANPKLQLATANISFLMWNIRDPVIEDTMNALVEALPPPDPNSIIPDDVVAVGLDSEAVLFSRIR